MIAKVHGKRLWEVKIKQFCWMEISGLTGYDDDHEASVSAEIISDTDQLAKNEAVELILQYLEG